MTRKEPGLAAPRGQSGNRISTRLVALSSSAVMAVYAAGYWKTQPAAAKLAAADRDRVVIPVAAPDTHGAHVSAVVPAAPEPEPKAPAAVTRIKTTPKPARPAKPVAEKAEVVTTPAAAPPIATPVVATTTEPPVPTPAPVQTAAAAPQYNDGAYTGWGTSRHGDIQATVTIENGRIAAAVISQCLTRYSCSWVAHLQSQVVTRQSPEVDYVSGATQSTNAFYYAVVEALSKAK
jgi:uncharacterized protein with FMN-binding domain